MRAAFYSPIASADERAPSGVSRVGSLLQRALTSAACEIFVPSLPRSYEGRGDAARQQALRAECLAAADRLIAQFREGRAARPDFWFSYHVYYKSPDWVGPRVASALKIPYLVAEGSHAPKRANGPWALGHEGTTAALKAADVLFAATSFDRVCLEWIDAARVRDLRPFIDVAPFRDAPVAHSRPVKLLAVAMMRNERKLESYRLLADALGRVNGDWRLSIAGDGTYRRAIEEAFDGFADRVEMLGSVPAERIPQLMSEADIFAWPGIGEAYGLVYLEAQAAGLPVAACRDRGVPDVVCDGATALLTPAGDAAALAGSLTRLMGDAGLRRAMGEKAQAFVHGERSIEAAAQTIKRVLAELHIR